MDHYYKYEGMSEEDRNGLIPYNVPLTAYRIDPEDSGHQDASQQDKQGSGGTVGSAKAYQRKTRDVYILLGNYGNGFEEEGPETDTWREMKQLLKEYRENCPQYRYSYRKRRIKINTQ